MEVKLRLGQKLGEDVAGAASKRGVSVAAYVRLALALAVDADTDGVVRIGDCWAIPAAKALLLRTLDEEAGSVIRE